MAKSDPVIVLSEPQKIIVECVKYAVNGNRSISSRIYIHKKYKLSNKQKSAASTCMRGRNHDFASGNRFEHSGQYPTEKCKNSTKTKNKIDCKALALGEQIFNDTIITNNELKRDLDLAIKKTVKENKHLYSVNRGRMFKGAVCTDDCSGHEAGYEWAEENDIDDLLDCENHSLSFQEGCEIFVSE